VGSFLGRSGDLCLIRSVDIAARARLDQWKQSLLDPTDRLLDLGDHGVPIALDPVRIAFALAAGSGFTFEAGADAAFAVRAGQLRVALPEDELARQLKALRRAAMSSDGEQQLWLALGLLVWDDNTGEDEDEPLEGDLTAPVIKASSRTAPLVLWPVQLEAGKQPRLVSAMDARPRVNDMLLEGLRREHDLEMDVGDDFDLAELLDRISGFAMLRRGWRVELTCRLVNLSFAKFDLWRDSEMMGDRATGDAACLPLVWLAAGGEPAPITLPPAHGEVLAPLDADTAQLSAIAAAGAGGSFILDGAPGTGTSQTIANLVVHCASQGKSVLVVSDRTSTLDVIGHRLAAAGLPEVCLPLYGAHADRTKVLGALSRVLDRAFRPGAGGSALEGRLAELRGELDRYPAALHRVGPLGMSVHEVLGRLVELRTTPRAALAERDAAALNGATFVARKAAVEALADAALPVEPVATHPWRMSALDAWSEDGTERATRALNALASATETLTSAISDVGKLVPNIIAKTPDQLRTLGALADLAADSPRPGAELLTNRGARNDEVGERVALIRARGGGTIEVPRDPNSFLAIATRHRALVREVDEFFTEAIEDLDACELWSQLKRWTTSMAALRYVALRNVRASIKAAAQMGQLETDEGMLSALEAVIAERACREALLAAAEPAKRWFGDLGGDALSLDLAKIEEAVAWSIELRRTFDQLSLFGAESARQAAWRALVAQVAASPATGERPAVELAPFARLAAAVTRWEPAIAEVSATTGIPWNLVGAGADHLASLREQVDLLRNNVGSLGEWTKFNLARKAATVAGIGPAITAIERGDLSATELASAWERANLLTWLELEIAETPALADFHGGAHHAHVTAYADLDRGSLALVRARAVARINERIPRARDAGAEGALLKDEASKPRGRALVHVLADLGTLLPRLAPCMLATPHSVAQHLAGSLPPFDLVVFDDASRLAMPTVLGALARAKAVVIAGDEQQPDVANSLFATARAAKLATVRLLTHYRSRHEDVFAFANSRYYGNAIEVLPAPFGSAELGISWRRIDGTPDVAGANRAEAESIVAELRSRLTDPTQRARSFAIVTLSRAQQELIEDILDDARFADTALAAAFEHPEPLLVGTPDRMQGEERDVAFVSIGDSADALGALAHPGGQRWLNVAVTRAREQLVVVSSFDPEQLLLAAPLSADPAAGELAPAARQLADLLAFARAGGGASKPVMDTAAASPITAAIARALTERGWQLAHNIGCGAYKLDLAVIDPNDPERYVLAIEHDGPMYAGSLSARSRDRLRAQQLAQLGWRTHRVWSLDWWLDPEREIQRAHGAIVAAVAACRQRKTAVTAAPTPKLQYKRRAKGTASPTASGSAPIEKPIDTAIVAALETTARLAAPEIDSLRSASTVDSVDDGWAITEETRPVSAPNRASGSAPNRAPIAAASARDSGQLALAIGSPNAVGSLSAATGSLNEASRSLDAATGALNAVGSSNTVGTPSALNAVSSSNTVAAPGAKVVVPASGQVLAAGSGPTDAVGALPFDLASAPIRIPRGAIAIGPYTAAAVPAGRRAPDDMFAPRYLGELGKCIEQVLAAEAPIHIDLLARRCAAYFGIGRITQRVTEQIRAALEGRGKLGPEENIVWRVDQDPQSVPPVRVAGNSASARREISEVPLSEVAAAARIVVERANGMSATDLVRDCARLLGFARITDKVSERVALGVRLATARELITIDAGKAHLLLDG
jgi:hypothetical protein